MARESRVERCRRLVQLCREGEVLLNAGLLAIEFNLMKAAEQKEFCRETGTTKEEINGFIAAGRTRRAEQLLADCRKGTVSSISELRRLLEGGVSVDGIGVQEGELERFDYLYLVERGKICLNAYRRAQNLNELMLLGEYLERASDRERYMKDIGLSGEELERFLCAIEKVKKLLQSSA